MPTRRRFVATGAALAGLAGLAGCSGLGVTGTSGGTPTATGGGDGGAESETPTATETGTPAGTGTATASSSGTPPTAASSLPVQYGFGDLQSAVRSGGPPKDGIPSIDDPAFVSPDEASLAPGDPVFGVVRGDDVRAYPQSVLVWHEIVNDVVGGDPVSVTYCPLTGTAMGFERGDTTFGTSGNLLNNNLVMYDRGTDSRWPQVMATAIEGALQGRSLREFPVTWTTFEAWTSRYPDSQVLSTETGYARNYGSDPYGAYNPKSGYYTSDGTLFERLNPDDRHEPKSVFLGVRTPGGAAVVKKSTLRTEKVVSGTVGDDPFVAVYGPDLDTGYVYRNPEALSVEWADGDVRVDGETFAPDALPLDRLVAPDGMWFAWIGFYPEAEVYA